MGYGSSAGAGYVVYGPVSGTITLGSDVRLEGASADDHLGRAAAILGDIDGDGYDDVGFGGEGVDDGGNGAGATYLLRGGTP